MDESVDYLDSVSGKITQSESALEEVMGYVNVLSSLNEAKEVKERELSDIEKRIADMENNTIPNLCAQNGITNVGLANGMHLYVDEVVEVYFPKNDEGAANVIRFLCDNGAADIVKDTLTVTDPEEALIKQVASQGYLVDRKRSVNTNSFKAWAKNALGMGKDGIQRIPPEQFPKDTNLFVHKKAFIKKEK